YASTRCSCSSPRRSRIRRSISDCPGRDSSLIATRSSSNVLCVHSKYEVRSVAEKSSCVSRKRMFLTVPGPRRQEKLSCQPPPNISLGRHHPPPAIAVLGHVYRRHRLHELHDATSALLHRG